MKKQHYIMLKQSVLLSFSHTHAKVHSHYPCEKPLIERAFVKAG